jgi:TonB-linked SusC/RagA family outer membrane protein
MEKKSIVVWLTQPNVYYHKLLLSMKITILLLLTCVLNTLANNSYSQTAKVTLNLKNARVEEVLNEIEKKSEYYFLLNQKLVDINRRVDVVVENSSIKDVLAGLFKNVDISYVVYDRQIILSPKDKGLTTGILQQQKITGLILDASTKEPLIGVNVVADGTNIGVISDANGKYSIDIPAGCEALKFSYVGYNSERIGISGKSSIDVTLIPDITKLGEVVVVALGIKRDKKALAYSVTEVKGDELTQAREINVANALAGKIAGVNATGISTGPGGSSRIVIRGNGSFTGDNQPLYVVNGMPIDNSTPGGSASANGGGLNIDRGDGISGINPDDIESISVLKGGTASALYGSRAANGVILITTKKGKAQEGIGIEYNSSLTLDAPVTYQDFQYEYGHGKMGRKPTTQAEAISWGRHSWGAKIDDQSYISIDGKEHPYSAVHVKDNVKEFYRTGSTFINTIAFTGGGANLNFRLSFSNTDSKGVLPSTSLNKKSANLNMNANLGKKISIEAITQFNLDKVNNRTMAGDANGNPNWISMLANTIDAQQLSPGYLPNGNEFQWNETPYATNPYFIVNRYQTEDKKNRFIGQANIKYSVNEHLFVKGSINRDFYSFNYVGIIPTGTQYTTPAGGGEYHGIKSNVSETNAMVTVNYSTKWMDMIHTNLMAGANRRNFMNDETYIDGAQFILPYFYSSTNLTTSTLTPSNQRSETNSAFGALDMDYKSLAFLTVTGRQDWFSTLNTNHNTIFYPSVGGSFLLSEAFNLPKVISFMKLRGSWAQVGGAVPDAYAVNLTYTMVQGGHNGQALQKVSSATITDPNLKPLTSTTYEIGLDTRLFENRAGIDITLYNRKTTDDIVQTAIPITSGYSYSRLNAGELQNQGIELLLTGTPVKSNGFSWEISYNAAYNESKVLKLAEGLNTIQMASSVGGWAGVYNDVNRPYGIIKGYRMAKDANGQQIYTTAGYEKRSDLVELGQGVAPLTMGITNTFIYKSFSLSVLIDGKFGNKVFSVMNTYANRFGLLKRTLAGRESGLVLNGVDASGNAYTRTVDYTTDAFRLYYDNQKNYSELFTYDGSFIKLRQIIFSYNIPSSALSFLKIKAASISLVGRNLAILYKKTEGFDPETSITNGNAQGFESFALPRTRNIGVNLLIKF